MTYIDKKIEIIQELNRRLASGTMFLDAHIGRNDSELVFRNMRHFAIEPTDSIILSLTPDGDDTVIGRLLTKDGRLYYFDFDPDDLSYSRLIRVPATDNPRQEDYLEEVAGAILLNARGIPA